MINTNTMNCIAVHVCDKLPLRNTVAFPKHLKAGQTAINVKTNRYLEGNDSYLLQNSSR